jgi:hypothetical protein
VCNRRLGALALALAFAASAGCSSSDESGGAPGPATYTSVPRGDAARVVAETTCGLWIDRCKCRFVPFPSKASCLSSATSFQEQQFQQAESAGLTYDPECMAEIANHLNHTIGCRPLSEMLDESPNDVPCKAFYGTGQEGDACERFDVAYGDTCAPGLECLGTCMPAQPEPTPRKEGEACDPLTDLCEAGTQCSHAGDPPTLICVRQPGAGESCTIGCDVGLYCDPTSKVCGGPPGEGQPCAFVPGVPRCASGLACVDATCVPALPEGAPCGNDSECGVGYSCQELHDEPDSPNVCLPEEAAICI